jgi:putative endopeptidase
MPRTQKHFKNKSHKSKTHRSKKLQCPIGLKPFEEEFSNKLLHGKNKSSSANRKKQFVKQLLSQFAPHSIKPKDNFYDYINYQWLKNVSVEQQQKYIVQVDNFRLTQDKVYRELDEIIVNYIKTHNDKLSQNLKNFRKSVLEMNPKPYSRKLAFEAVDTIEHLFKLNNPWKLLAYFNNDEMICNSAPFVWSLNPDEKNTKVYRCYVTSHQFELVDLSIYYDDGTDVSYKRKYRSEYKKHIKQVFNILLGKNHYNPQDVFDVEVELFNTFGCTEVKTDEDVLYNKVYRNEALKKYGFNWEEFSKEIGFKEPPEFFITANLNYLKCASTVFLENWNSEKWKTYWLYILLKRLVRITRGWEDIIYKFKGLFERGQEGINKSDAVSASLYMSVPFNTFLTNEYVRKYENPQYMEYVKIMCEDLKIVFKKILMRNTWLQPSTKQYALKKLAGFNFIYGKPDDLRADPDLNYGTLLYDNMKKIHEWRHKKLVELEGKGIIDIPMMDWTQYPVKMGATQAYIVNASYTPAKNSIFINLGYIQKPFVDLDERGIEYNLAHIGNTLAHEMSHGFDDTGSKYGVDGNLHDWWTTEDKRKYKAIQADVTKQYEEFAARDGIKFDASIATGENLADISAVAICDEYLRDYQEKNDDLIPIRNFSYEAYYTYFAFQQRQKVGKKAIRAQLKTNPHPLDKYRCNVPLSRSEIFKALYNVKKGDGMWWHNTETVW